MNAVNTRARYRLYRKYIKELSKFDKDLRYCTADEINDWAKAYISDEQNGHTTWIDIKEDGKIVGFIIISHRGGDCHPACNHYISQTYLLPEYRKNGLISNKIKSFIDANPGVYGYDVIKQNRPARQYWDKLFDSLCAKPVQLSRIRDEEFEKKVDVYGYEISKR